MPCSTNNHLNLPVAVDSLKLQPGSRLRGGKSSCLVQDVCTRACIDSDGTSTLRRCDVGHRSRVRPFRSAASSILNTKAGRRRRRRRAALPYYTRKGRSTQRESCVGDVITSLRSTPTH
ncbi:hypothetical protein Zmor_015283 [Zophobas morio]|uniref:Uncharacterized protein n=1 Tax=Zophobas morio TaxID=2755281 RepID=A0AA38ILX7_9CUCU|nr:hypothetical protein Zmor_015283 [Zophobas morio]